MDGQQAASAVVVKRKKNVALVFWLGSLLFKKYIIDKWTHGHVHREGILEVTCQGQGTCQVDKSS